MNQTNFARSVLGMSKYGQSKVSQIENGLQPTPDQIERMNQFAQTHSIDWKYPVAKETT